MKKLIIIILVLLVIGFAVWRMIVGSTAEEEEFHAGISVIKVTSVQKRTIDRILDYDGVAYAVNEAYVLPDVPGIVSRVVKKPGETVKKDEAIILIDRSQLGLDFAPAEVRSPVSGRVLDILADPGSRVGPQQPVAIVGVTEEMEIRIEVSPAEARLLAEGQAARVTTRALGEMEFFGKVSRISASLNPVTRKIPIRIKVSNPTGELIPGMMCIAEITVDTRELLSVPNSALLLRDGKLGVFAVSEEETAEWKEVEKVLQGRKYSGLTGLPDGEAVAYDGNYGLIPGGKVIIEE